MWDRLAVQTSLLDGISADDHGNLYVGERTQSCVLVLSAGGEFICSFGNSKGVKMLDAPHGVCVSGEYVYVTDWVKHNVSVFTTAGEHVTTFGE